MSDSEQRSPTVVTVQQAPPIEGRDAITAEIDRLNSLLAAEEARIKAEEAENTPPRPVDEILMDFVSRVTALLGNHPAVDSLHRELRRAFSK
ncbi:MAG TPA: hypothetical protein VM912_04795 [Terriglobales bacterium]|nr:hypothetical protein [Terriglobales bacterium]